MSKISRFKAALAKMLSAFGNVSTDRGILAWDGDEDLKVGDAIYIEDQDGNRLEAEDGEYVTSDAKTIVVEGGKVAEIRDPEAEVAPQEEPAPEVEMGRVATDKGELLWEGEGDLAEGMEVFVEGEEGRVPAPDGEYTIEDGKVIVVVEGKVAEIRDPKAEVAPEEEAPAVDEEKEELRKENAELRNQVQVLTRKMEEMSRIPVGKSAHEEVSETGKTQKTGIKGLDRFSRYAEAGK